MIKSIIFRLFLALLVFSAPASADQPNPVELVMPSGLRIITLENPGSRTVSVNVFIAAGSLDESPETTGLAHFYEHMFFRGTPTLSGLAFKKAIEDRGGITNATTAKDMTHYFISLPAEEAEEGLKLLADALIRPELAQDGIDVERDVVLEEYRIGENNPGRLATEGLYELAYGSHPYALSTIGTKERIKSYNREDFQRWKNLQYGPSRCTIVVVGGIEANAIAQKAKFLFAAFKGENAQNRDLKEPPALPNEPVYKEGFGPVGSPVVMLGFPAPAASSTADVCGVDVLSFILGQGTQSLLHRNLVKKQELAESIGVTYLTPRQRGLIIFSAVSKANKAEELRLAVLSEIENLKQGKFEDEDLVRAKAQLLQSFSGNNETNSGKADTIGFYCALGVPGFWKDYPKEIQSVTREDVIKAAKTYLNSGHWGYTLSPNRGRSKS